MPNQEPQHSRISGPNPQGHNCHNFAGPNAGTQHGEEVQWEEARTLLYELGAQLRTQLVARELANAAGHVLANDVYSPIDAPHYTNAAMDGYAVAGSGPWTLSATSRLHPGQAVPIVTGQAIPPGTTRVVPWEDVVAGGKEVDEDNKLGGTGSGVRNLTVDILPTAQALERTHIRHRGEDLHAGDLIMRAGTRLHARHLALLASVGIDRVHVYENPTAAVAYTGNEVISRGVPGPGQVRNAFAPSFPHTLNSLYCQVKNTQTIADDPQALKHWLHTHTTGMTGVSVAMVTGGSSHSRVDWLRRTLAQLDAKVVFSSVNVRPGHPALAARLHNTVVLGLPGNPLAAYTTVLSFLPQVIAGMTGARVPDLQHAQLRQQLPYSSATRVLPAVVEADSTGSRLRILPKVRSHMLMSLAQANALAVLPPGEGSQGAECTYLALGTSTHPANSAQGVVKY